MPFVRARLCITLLLADFDEGLHLRSSVIGESKLLEFALLHSVMDCLGCILKGRRAIGYMQKDGLRRGSFEGIKRPCNAHFDLGRLMGSSLTVADFGVNSEPRRSTCTAEACLRRTWSIGSVVLGSIDVPIATAVERIQEALNIFRIIEMCNPRVRDTIANLSSSNQRGRVASGRTYVPYGFRE